ncbi:MAG TPA: hypothetical protein DEF41_05135 [Desulfovibrio sp.]|nr:hypothetical protein [Desulfovibrio sp.]
MSTTIDELTVDYEEDGKLVVKQLDKAVLSKGAWTTILFRYKQWEEKLSDYGPDKYVVKRYKKMNGEYRAQSKFNISSADQAQKIVDTLQGWLQEQA